MVRQIKSLKEIVILPKDLKAKKNNSQGHYHHIIKVSTPAKTHQTHIKTNRKAKKALWQLSLL